MGKRRIKGNDYITIDDCCYVIVVKRDGSQEYFLISRDDLEICQKYTWNITHKGYVVTWDYNDGYKFLQLHRFLLKPDSKLCVDHINGDKLDNTRENLRICTNQENSMNQHNIFGISKYKGVSWHKRDNKWTSRITVNYKSIYLGYFKSEEEAAKAYNEAAIKYHGAYAKLNEVA